MSLFDRLQTKARGLPKHIIPGTTVKRHMAAGLRATGNLFGKGKPGGFYQAITMHLAEGADLRSESLTG